MDPESSQQSGCGIGTRIELYHPDLVGELGQVGLAAAREELEEHLQEKADLEHLAQTTDETEDTVE
jgi:hypothetical protein